MDNCDFLIEHGADRIRHSGRTLYRHLRGTYDLLVQAGADHEVCAAGLFHSVYGTNAFKQVLIPRDQRELVRAQIGERAEGLVWQFCTIDRPRCFLKRTNTDRDLIQIEIANLREQGNVKTVEALERL